MNLRPFKPWRYAGGLAVTLAVAAISLYPVYYLLQAAFDVGDPDTRPPTAYGLNNFIAIGSYVGILGNTLMVAFAATLMALVFGFITAWILNRTDVPFKATLEQAMAVPYYVTPLLGAFAWSLLGSPESGLINQAWVGLGFEGPLIDITSPLGIAWVMALFEGAVAFVMIGAVMKSMDPSLEEASQVLGGSRLNTIFRVTLPLVLPGVLGAAIYVFAEMMGSFSAALVLGTPARFYVITTAIYQLVSQYPPRIPLAAAMGVSLFGIMFLMLFFYRRMISRGNFVTVGGKAFRPRVIRMGRLRWVMFAVCAAYVLLAVVLPVATLAFASVQKLTVALPKWSDLTLEHYREAMHMNAVQQALGNSLLLALTTATLGGLLAFLLAWTIQRSKLPFRGALEYMVMFPQSVPRLVFAFGMMWAWLVFPLPVYGTIWLLLIAYLTVFMPLGVRTITGVMVQLDKSLDECGRVCGAPWMMRMRTITMPLLKPGLYAAWMLLFVASVRELGASILLMGPHSKVITPSIVESWFATSSELTAAMALIQTTVIGVAIALFTLLTRRASQHKV